MDRDELLHRFDLTDRVAIVTGGSRGIGRAIAGGFAAMGATVVIASRKADACERAVREIEAAGGRALAVPTHTGDLDQITIKDGAKAVIKIGRSAESLHELYDAADKAVLIVVSDVGGHLGGMDGVTGEADQRGLDLGHEYRDDDGGGMDDSNVIDAAPALPAPDDDDQPTDAELDAAYEEGYQAAADGKPESDCPAADGQICIAWVKGWKDWHDNEASAA